MRKQAVLMMCHFCNDIVKDRYHKLISELDSDKYDVFVLFNNDTDLNFNFGEHSYVYSFRTEDLNELGYESIADTIVPGSTHFAVLNFFKEHNNYKHYWYVEYDVVFSGNWSALLDAFESNDMLGGNSAKIVRNFRYAIAHKIFFFGLAVSIEQLNNPGIQPYNAWRAAGNDRQITGIGRQDNP